MDKLRISSQGFETGDHRTGEGRERKIRCFTKSTLERQMEAGDQAATKKSRSHKEETQRFTD